MAVVACLECLVWVAKAEGAPAESTTAPADSARKATIADAGSEGLAVEIPCGAKGPVAALLAVLVDEVMGVDALHAEVLGASVSSAGLVASAAAVDDDGVWGVVAGAARAGPQDSGQPREVEAPLVNDAVDRGAARALGGDAKGRGATGASHRQGAADDVVVGGALGQQPRAQGVDAVDLLLGRAGAIREPGWHTGDSSRLTFLHLVSPLDGSATQVFHLVICWTELQRSSLLLSSCTVWTMWFVWLVVIAREPSPSWTGHRGPLCRP